MTTGFYSRRLLLSARSSAVVVAVAAAIVAAHLVTALPAYASNFGSTACGGSPRNCVSLADNALHEWCEEGTLGNQIPGIYTTFVESMDDYDEYTDLTTSHVCPITSNRDVIVTDAEYGPNNGIVAWVECLPTSATSGSHPNLRCDQQKLRFNSYSAYSNYYDSYSNRLSISCHEIGHTVGLRHTNSADTDSCMDNFSESRSTLTSLHDDSHINGNY